MSKPYFMLRRKLLLAGLAATFVNPAQAKLLSSPVSETQWQWLRQLKGIATKPGMTTPMLYVFFDPDCPWSRTLWIDTRLPDGRSFNTVPAVWIPVPYFSKDSPGKAAALLRADDVESLSHNFGAGYNVATRSGGIAPVTPNDAEIKALSQSKGVWLDLGGATPLLVWRSRDGKALKHIGSPRNPEDLQRIVESVAPSQLDNYRP